MKIFSVTLLLGVAAYFMNTLYTTWLPRNYIFDPIEVNQLCNDVLSKHNSTSENFSTEALLRDVRDALATRYISTTIWTRNGSSTMQVEPWGR